MLYGPLNVGLFYFMVKRQYFNILIILWIYDFKSYNLRTCVSLDEMSQLHKLYYQQLQFSELV